MCSLAADRILTVCPGCGITATSSDPILDDELNATRACRELCFEVWYYTLALNDPYFFHQLVVDAYAAQHSGPRVKPITTAFALIGLYLVWERGFTGKQVQRAHVHLARRWREWPRFTEPSASGDLTIEGVVRAAESEKQEAIKEWHRSVWNVWESQGVTISGLLQERMGIK